jgi:hypothetical protein
MLNLFKILLIKILLIIIVFGTYSNSNFVFGQGFDWQWSARLPFQAPRLYLGIGSQYGFQFASGDISFLEDKIQCQNFNDGTGNNYVLGLNFEYWEELNQFAYRGSILYGISTLNSSSIDYIPYSSDIIAEYETKLSLNFSKIDVKIG